MALLQSALARIGSLSQTLQILLILPLTLDFLGPPSFLLLSLLLTLHQFTYSTLRLALKNTIAAPLIPVFNVFNPLFPPLSALVVCWLYLRSEGSISSAPLSSHRWRELLMDKLPGWYAFSLRIAAPVFSLLEGFATLLVAQLLGRITKAYVDDTSPLSADYDSDKDSVEWRRLAALVVSAVLYCIGFGWLLKAHPLSPPGTPSQLPPILLGGALATVFFLTMIGFSRRRATVVETALMFLYVVYGGWMSGKEELLEPRQFGQGWLTSGWGQARPLPTFTVDAMTSPIAHHLATIVSILPIPLPLLFSILKPLSTIGSVVVSVLGNVGRILGINVGKLGVWAGIEGLGGSPDASAALSDRRFDATTLISAMLQHSGGALSRIGSSLPPTLLVSLCFRLLMLHFAARIIPAIRRAAAGWDDSVEEQSEGRRGFWDGRRLGEEPPSARATTILLSYRKAILIAVYTHLLLLDQGAQLWWRWINIYVTLAVWALELTVEEDLDDDGESIKSWKVD